MAQLGDEITRYLDTELFGCCILSFPSGLFSTLPKFSSTSFLSSVGIPSSSQEFPSCIIYSASIPPSKLSFHHCPNHTLVEFLQKFLTYCQTLQHEFRIDTSMYKIGTMSTINFHQGTKMFKTLTFNM